MLGGRWSLRECPTQPIDPCRFAQTSQACASTSHPPSQHTKPSVTSHVSAKAHVGVCNIVSCCTVQKRYKTRWFCSEGVFHTSPSTPAPLPRYRGSLLRNEQTPNEHVVQPAARALLATGSSVLLNVSILVFVAK